MAAKLKVENKQVMGASKERKSHDFEGFIKTIKTLKPGQSFTIPALPSHFRIGISAAEMLLSIQIATRREDGGIRVGRIS